MNSSRNSLKCIFIGFQETEIPHLKLRLYNIEGDHKLNKSTVTIDTLIQNNIPILDLNEDEINNEYRKIKKWLRGESE